MNHKVKYFARCKRFIIYSSLFGSLSPTMALAQQSECAPSADFLERFQKVDLEFAEKKIVVDFKRGSLRGEERRIGKSGSMDRFTIDTRNVIGTQNSIRTNLTIKNDEESAGFTYEEGVGTLHVIPYGVDSIRIELDGQTHLFPATEDHYDGSCSWSPPNKFTHMSVKMCSGGKRWITARLPLTLIHAIGQQDASRPFPIKFRTSLGQFLRCPAYVSPTEFAAFEITRTKANDKLAAIQAKQDRAK